MISLPYRTAQCSASGCGQSGDDTPDQARATFQEEEEGRKNEDKENHCRPGLGMREILGGHNTRNSTTALRRG